MNAFGRKSSLSWIRGGLSSPRPGDAFSPTQGDAGARIRAVGLSKRYGEACDALVDVSLEVPPGQVVALVGPNGAGKSTLLKALAGLVVPTAGRAFVDGFAAGSVEAKERVGYLPQRVALPGEMRVSELLRFFAGLRRSLREGRSGPQRIERAVAEAIEAAGLEGLESRRIRELSGGMQQRVGLAQALLGEPSVLLLDEPATGLDADARDRLQTILEALRIRGGSAVLATHRLDDVAAVADRVVALGSGRVLADEGIESMRQRLGHRLVIHTPDAARAVKWLGERGLAVTASPAHPQEVRVACTVAEAVFALRLLEEAGVPILSFRTERAGLLEVLQSELGPREGRDGVLAGHAVLPPELARRAREEGDP